MSTPRREFLVVEPDSESDYELDLPSSQATKEAEPAEDDFPTYYRPKVVKRRRAQSDEEDPVQKRKDDLKKRREVIKKKNREDVAQMKTTGTLCWAQGLEGSKNVWLPCRRITTSHLSVTSTKSLRGQPSKNGNYKILTETAGTALVFFFNKKKDKGWYERVEDNDIVEFHPYDENFEKYVWKHYVPDKKNGTWELRKNLSKQGNRLVKFLDNGLEEALRVYYENLEKLTEELRSQEPDEAEEESSDSSEDETDNSISGPSYDTDSLRERLEKSDFALEPGSFILVRDDLHRKYSVTQIAAINWKGRKSKNSVSVRLATFVGLVFRLNGSQSIQKVISPERARELLKEDFDINRIYLSPAREIYRFSLTQGDTGNDAQAAIRAQVLQAKEEILADPRFKGIVCEKGSERPEMQTDNNGVVEMELEMELASIKNVCVQNAGPQEDHEGEKKEMERSGHQRHEDLLGNTPLRDAMDRNDDNLESMDLTPDEAVDSEEAVPSGQKDGVKTNVESNNHNDITGLDENVVENAGSHKVCGDSSVGKSIPQEPLTSDSVGEECQNLANEDSCPRNSETTTKVEGEGPSISKSVSTISSDTLDGSAETEALKATTVDVTAVETLHDAVAKTSKDETVAMMLDDCSVTRPTTTPGSVENPVKLSTLDCDGKGAGCTTATIDAVPHSESRFEVMDVNVVSQESTDAAVENEENVAAQSAKMEDIVAAQSANIDTVVPSSGAARSFVKTDTNVTEKTSATSSSTKLTDVAEAISSQKIHPTSCDAATAEPTVDGAQKVRNEGVAESKDEGAGVGVGAKKTDSLVAVPDDKVVVNTLDVVADGRSENAAGIASNQAAVVKSLEEAASESTKEVVTESTEESAPEATEEVVTESMNEADTRSAEMI